MAGYAALNWYELPETRSIQDRLWAGLADHLRAAGVSPVPPSLTRSADPHEALRRDDLTLAQICGYVVGGVGRDRLVPVATLRHATAECDGTSYRSLFTVRAASGIERFEDLAGARAVINDPLSHSGCNTLRNRVTQITRDRFFASIEVSGAHAASIDWLRAGRADVAAIDCITWALVSRHRPAALDGLTVIERSPLAPSPPLVSHLGNAHHVHPLRAALRNFFADDATRPEREGVLWEGFEVLGQSVYAALVPAHEDVAGFGVG